MTLILVSIMGFSQSQRYYELKNYYINYGYSIGLEQYANVTEGMTAYINVKFYPNTSYVIVAMSDDNDVLDVDIFTYYTSGNLFMKDNDNSSVAIVSFNCYSESSLKVVIKNYSSRTPRYASCLRYFIAYKEKL